MHLPTFYTCPGSHDGVPTHDGVLDESVFLAGMGMEWGESQWGAGSTNKIDNFNLQSDGLRLWSLKLEVQRLVSVRPSRRTSISAFCKMMQLTRRTPAFTVAPEPIQTFGPSIAAWHRHHAHHHNSYTCNKSSHAIAVSFPTASSK